MKLLSLARNSSCKYLLRMFVFLNNNEALEWFSVKKGIIIFILYILKTYLGCSGENGIKEARDYCSILG